MQRIFIVNNDFETMSLLKSWLEKKNYEILFTADKNEIIPFVKRFGPHLLLIDVLYKEIIEELKMIPKISRIPILLMTGYSHDNNETPEVNDTIEKPFDLPLLQQKIERLLSLGVNL
jgi:CheY-like chemotaxis protein